MRTLLLSALPMEMIPEDWKKSTQAYAHHINTESGPKNLLRPLYSKLRCGDTIALFPPSKRWYYTKQGQRFVDELKILAKGRRFEMRWLNPGKPHGKNGISTIQTPQDWTTLVQRRSAAILTPTQKYLVFIGDVHGYLDTLKKLVTPWLDKDALFIFTGDYVSKGPDSLKTLEWINQTLLKPGKAHLLTGNHELHLEDWAMGLRQNKSDFLNTWPSQYNPGGYSSKRFTRHFLSHLEEALDIRWHGYRFLVSHGGLEYPENHHEKASHYIYGPGGPHTDIDSLWDSKNTEPKTIQIHGHRNTTLRATREISTSWNLEGIESSEEIRSVVLEKDKNEIKGNVITNSFSGKISKFPFSLQIS